MNTNNLFYFGFILIVWHASVLHACEIDQLKNSRQQVISIVEDINSYKSTIYLVENRKVLKKFKGVIGRNGISENKREGDGKSPSGIFSLSFGFGSSSKIETKKFPYTIVTKDSHCIDDVDHPKYNKILFNYKKPSHISSENLKEVGAPYEFAVAVDYNHLDPNSKNSPIRSHGSCIFLHVWKQNSKDEVGPTAGCTAYSRDNMIETLNWLDKNKNPLLIQLTRVDYQKLNQSHCFPESL